MYMDPYGPIRIYIDLYGSIWNYIDAMNINIGNSIRMKIFDLKRWSRDRHRYERFNRLFT